MKNRFLLIPISMILLSSCGKETPAETHTHKYVESSISWTWTSSSTGYEVSAHTACETCKKEITQDAYVELVSSTATCVKDGQKEYKATAVFGNIEYSNSKTVTVKAYGHNISGGWNFDENNHYYKCNRCEEHVNSEAHTFGDWEILIEPDYGVAGLRAKTCSICNYEYEEEIAALIPSVAVVQEAVDKVNKGPFPYSYQYIENAKKLYGLLPELEKNLVTGYEDMDEVKTKYEESYDIISNVLNREVRKRDANQLDYSGTWEGDIYTNFDDSHGNVNVLDIKTVGTGWGSDHYNGISFNEDSYDVSLYKEIKFAIYNPASSSSGIRLYTNGWFSIPNDVVHTLKSGWNDLSFVVKNGAYNSKDGYHDFDLNEFSIILTNNQVNDGWLISNFYGLKSTQKEIENVINLIDALKDPESIIADDQKQIEDARKAYEDLTEYGKTKVTNVSKLIAVEKALSNLLASKVVNLIDALPSKVESDIFLTFAKLDKIEVEYNKLYEDAKKLVTNYDVYETLKNKFEESYKVIYNPRTYNGVAANGVSHASYSLSTLVDETYGPMLKIDADVQKGYSQLYAYSFPSETFGELDKLNFKIYSSFEEKASTSQTYWAGVYSTAKKINIAGQNWTNISDTGSNLNSNGCFKTSLNAVGNSFINLQRWGDDSVLPDPYQGYYYVSAIIVTLNK